MGEELASEARPDAPSVVERGTYSEQGAGPEDDTAVYAPDITQGRISPGPSDRRVDRTARLLSRERLARREAPPEFDREPAPSRRLPTMGLLVTVFVVLCIAGVALALSLSKPAPAPAAPQAQPTELPDQIDGVPVRRGLRRGSDAAATP